MRILLVEDEDRIASFIMKGLSAEGHGVERASTVEEAVGLALAHDFDVLLLDLLLPDGNGRDVLAAVRTPRAGRAPVTAGTSAPTATGPGRSTTPASPPR